MFRVVISPSKERKWLRYVGVALLITFIIKDPVVAAHLADNILGWVTAGAAKLSTFASNVHAG